MLNTRHKTTERHTHITRNSFDKLVIHWIE
jgi:hypothetical protein